MSLLSADFRVGLPSIPILTAMSDSKSLNTSLLEVMTSSKDRCVFIRDLSLITMEIILVTGRALMNLRSKWPIAWNNPRRAPL